MTSRLIIAVAFFSLCSCRSDEQLHMHERIRLLYTYAPIYECEKGVVDISDEIHDMADKGICTPRETIFLTYITAYAILYNSGDIVGMRETVDDYIDLIRRCEYFPVGTSHEDVEVFFESYVKINPPYFMASRDVRNIKKQSTPTYHCVIEATDAGK